MMPCFSKVVYGGGGARKTGQTYIYRYIHMYIWALDSASLGGMVLQVLQRNGGVFF